VDSIGKSPREPVGGGVKRRAPGISLHSTSLHATQSIQAESRTRPVFGRASAARSSLRYACVLGVTEVYVARRGRSSCLYCETSVVRRNLKCEHSMYTAFEN